MLAMMFGQYLIQLREICEPNTNRRISHCAVIFHFHTADAVL